MSNLEAFLEEKNTVSLRLKDQGLKALKEKKCVSTEVIANKNIAYKGDNTHDVEQIYDSLIKLAEEGIKLRNHTDEVKELQAFVNNADAIFTNLSNHKIIDSPSKKEGASKLRLCNSLKGLNDLIKSLQYLGLIDLFSNPKSTSDSVDTAQSGGAKKRSSKKSSKKLSKKSAKQSSSKKSRSKK